MVDDFMGDLEERREKEAEKAEKARKAGEEPAMRTTAEQAAGQRLQDYANSPDGTTPETALPPERIEQDDAAEESWLSGRRASGDLPDVSEVENYIRQSAQRFNIDPDAAVAVARTEGLAPNVWQSRVARSGRGGEGGREASFGPFQLYMGGGLGNEFQKATGLDPRDPSTWKQQVDFSLGHAARIGQWYDPTPGSTAGPWFGPRDKGLPHNYGFRQRQAAIPMEEEEAMQYGMQPTFFANAGGAIPDGQTTFTSQAPNAQGSVFLKHETQRPQQQARACRCSPSRPSPSSPSRRSRRVRRPPTASARCAPTTPSAVRTPRQRASQLCSRQRPNPRRHPRPTKGTRRFRMPSGDPLAPFTGIPAAVRTSP
jgi:hypothetical protein